MIYTRDQNRWPGQTKRQSRVPIRNPTPEGSATTVYGGAFSSYLDKADAEGINDRLSELRRQSKAHTERFEHLLGEYRQTRRKERQLREQIQHDVANQLVWLSVS